MDKTHNISLGGFSFLIEDKAYQELSKYLNEVRKSLGNTSDTNEIIYDVEQRMAELLKTQMKGREVIVNQDVDYLISVLGRPEQYVDLEEETQKEAKFTTNEKQNRIVEFFRHKKLYRDLENKLLAGVFAGFGHFLAIEKTWLRFAYLWLFAFSVLIFRHIFYFSKVDSIVVFFPWLAIYVLLALIIPSAKTTAEKLAMHGKAVNIDTISSIKEIKMRNGLQLTRSLENRKLFGVFGGLSKHYGWNVAGVRIAYVVLTLATIPLFEGFFTFVFILCYVFLVLSMNKRKTIFEKEDDYLTEDDFNVESDFSQENTPKQKMEFVYKKSDFSIWSIIRGFFKGVLYVIIGFVILILLFVFFSLFLVFLGVNVAFLGVTGALATVYDYLPFLFAGFWQLSAVYIALTMLLFVAICVPTMVLIQLFSSKSKKISKNWVIANVLLFFIGIIVMLVVAGNTARDFRYHRSVSKNIPLENIADTLKIKVKRWDNYGDSWNLYIEDDGKAVIEDNNWVEIKRTERTPFLEIWTSSQGANGRDAEQNAKKVDYPLEISGNTITIPEYYILDKNNKYRMQKVTLLLNVPDDVVFTFDSDIDTFFEQNYYWLKKGNHYRIHNDSLVNTATNLKEDNKRKEIRFHSRGRWHKQRVD
ncbi:PspC domain-containing protein [Capnocytophaga canimorsus]|uniref:PspC domain-containing protein n=1 Tax=Capnocytophaga canimorsus TaxID=28188 RepID=UPI001562464C|nr:PspC domain-containing protein [Capnocytophaga canimorsus]